MEASENNTLIAKYEGFYFVNDDTEAYPNGYYYLEEIGSLEAKDMEYHADWNWLMPVVEQIMKDYLFAFNVSVVMIAKTFDSPNIITVRYDKQQPLITAYYQAVVEFIKWHNLYSNDGQLINPTPTELLIKKRVL